jgi:N-acetylmuramoyl-L-alanine amidase
MREVYPDTQIHALSALLAQLEKSLPGLESIAGHADLDTAVIPSEDKPGVMVRRKLDPGPKFPWDDVLKTTNLRFLNIKMQ